MRVTRCFVPLPLQAPTQLSLPRGPAQHLAKVLRLRPGAAVTLFDGRGGEFAAEIIEVRRGEVRVAVLEHREIEREAPLRVTLLQSLARGERMDLIVQKATELGVAAIVPLSSEHSAIHLTDEVALRRREHWRQIAIGACEQCGRNRIPEIQPLTTLEEACAHIDAAALRVLLRPQAQVSLPAALAGASVVVLLIGPEGGWSPEDLALSQRFAFQPVSLGPRVLRTETAALAALAAAQTVAGDWR